MILGGPRKNGNDDAPSTSAKKRKLKDDDWDCGVCGINFTRDVKKKTGAEWIQCSFCFRWYHFKCQNGAEEDCDVFMCGGCQSDSDED